MPRDASGRIIPGSYGPGRSGEEERALQPFGPQTLSEYQGRHNTQEAIGGPGIDFRAAGINPQVPNINVQRAMVGEEPVDERFEPGSHLENQELTAKYREIQAAYPDASQEEMDEIYRKYQEELHRSGKKGKRPLSLKDWLQQDADPFNDLFDETTSNLPEDLQKRIALGRKQQGRQAGQPEMMQEMPTSSMQQYR